MNDVLASTTSITLPILLLIALGAFLRIRGTVTEAGVDQFKRVIVRVALPAVLFSSFLTVEFDASYLGLMVYVPLLCFALLGAGVLFGRTRSAREYSPYLMTGFEFGMLGITLFATAFGMDNVGVIGIVGLSHEFFIWFVYVSFLEAKRGDRRSFAGTVRSFASSPVIIAIVSGTLLNVLGAGPWFKAALVPAALLKTMEYLSGLIAPTILIVVGYGMRIDLRGIGEALPTVLVRAALIAVVAFVLNPLVVGVLGLPTIFLAALTTFVILPPPYIVPLFVPAGREEQMAFSNNVLSIYTVLSIAAFLVYVATTVA